MEQLQNTELKVPLLVKIIAIFILVTAIGTVWKGFFEFFFPGISHSTLSGIWVLVYGIGLIFVALDIRRMRRWALYVFTGVTVFQLGQFLYLLFTYPSMASGIIIPVIDIAVIAYLWSLFKRFK